MALDGAGLAGEGWQVRGVRRVDPRKVRVRLERPAEHGLRFLKRPTTLQNHRKIVHRDERVWMALTQHRLSYLKRLFEERLRAGMFTRTR